MTTKKQITKIKRGLKGIYNLSPDYERLGEIKESYFSRLPCDICRSKLAGDRYPAIGILGKKLTDPKIELSICIDCYEYLFI